MLFTNRREAGQALGAKLRAMIGGEDCVVLALPRGGVPVGFEVARLLRAPLDVFLATEPRELEPRAELYRGDRPAIELRGKTAVLVDDGLATGARMRAAVQALRELRPSRIVVGVPVAEQATCEALGDLVDEIVCCSTPEPFHEAAAWYDDFSQTSDEEVKSLLEKTVREQRRREPTRLRGLV